MRRIFIPLLLALSLAGCASLQNIQTAVQLGTASIANPVTPTRLYQMENAAILVFAGLETWKKACVNGAIPSSCIGQIASVQVYTRQIGPYLVQLRRFVKSNDQVNAVSVWNNVIAAIDTVKAGAAASGIVITTSPGA